MKTCTKCLEAKTADAFSKNKRSKDGLCVWCKNCSKMKQKSWRSQRKEDLAQKNKDYYLNNRERCAERSAAYRERNFAAISRTANAYYANNKAKIEARNKIYRENNAELYREIAKRQREKNPHRSRSNASMRRSRIRKAIPKWADATEILKIYALAAEMERSTGEPHDVDHIVPLVSPLLQSLDYGNTLPRKNFVGPLMPIVCGLHCQQNLEPITEKDNRRKSNIKWPDMPELRIPE